MNMTATATKEKTVPLSLVEQIERGIADLRERRAEVRRLDKESAELANSDVERSIELDLRARAIERFCTRQRAIIEDLIRQRHQAEYEEHCRLVDDLYNRKITEARAVAEALRKAGADVHDAIQRLAKIGGGDLSGDTLLKDTPRGSFGGQIAGLLGFRLSSLARAALNLKRHGADVSYFPQGNMSDNLCFAELRQSIKDLVFEKFEIIDEEPEPLVAVSQTH
jgi:hypothetical protein